VKYKNRIVLYAEQQENVIDRFVRINEICKLFRRNAFDVSKEGITVTQNITTEGFSISLAGVINTMCYLCL
jgi:hypothetical protein